MIPTLPLYILTCLNDTKTDEMEIGNQLMDLEDDVNVTFLSSLVVSINQIANEKIILKRHLILDKHYNIIYREKPDVNPEYNKGEFISVLTSRDYIKTRSYFDDMIESIMMDPDYASIFEYMDNIIKTAFCGKITNKKLELIKLGVCALAFHMSCVIIRESGKFEVKRFMSDKNVHKVAYWPFVINQHDENPLLERANTGLMMLFKQVQNPLKYSSILLDLIELILPIYLNGSITEDKEIGITPMDSNISVELHLFATTHSDILDIKSNLITPKK